MSIRSGTLLFDSTGSSDTVLWFIYLSHLYAKNVGPELVVEIPAYMHGEVY